VKSALISRKQQYQELLQSRMAEPSEEPHVQHIEHFRPFFRLAVLLYGTQTEHPKPEKDTGLANDAAVGYFIRL